jgi:hypothetical protein
MAGNSALYRQQKGFISGFTSLCSEEAVANERARQIF